MKKSLILFAATLLLAGILAAQETRREAVNPAASPELDAKPNSDQVPDAYAIRSQFQRVVIVRLKFDTDLLGGLQKIVKQEKIKNAVILAGAGSVRGYSLHSVSNRTFPSKDVYVTNPTGPADLVSMNGYIVNGRVHSHVTLTNGDKAFGGHLEPGTNVFTFAIVTLGILGDDADLRRIDDKTYR